ncbi:MAG: sensor [Rhodothermaceae bacterium]|nr:MAG: sensor [Rhodothermaceae bacterium]
MEPQAHDNKDYFESLAQRIGQLREEGKPLNEDEELAHDPFVRALFLLEPKHKFDPSRSDRLWQALEEKVHPVVPERSPLRLIIGRPRIWARVAASVLILLVAGLGWWILHDSVRAPVLVAEAQSIPFEYVASDASQITLRPHSRLYLVSSSEERMVYRLEGEAYFKVSHNPTRRFQVESGTVRVTVLGTRFNVSTWNGFEVYLEQGRVQVEGAHESIVLTSGQRTLLTSEGRLLPPEPASGERYLDWLQGQLVFDGEAASEVAAELAHHFGIEIVIPEPYGTQTLSGTLLLDDVSHALNDLAHVLGGSFVEEKPGRYRYDHGTRR